MQDFTASEVAFRLAWRSLLASMVGYPAAAERINRSTEFIREAEASVRKARCGADQARAATRKAQLCVHQQKELRRLLFLKHLKLRSRMTHAEHATLRRLKAGIQPESCVECSGSV